MTRKSKKPQKRKKVSALKSTEKSAAQADLRRWFYEKNKKLLEHPVNKKFEEVLWMSDAEFTAWMKELRQVVVELWRKEKVPPVGAIDEDEIVEQFAEIESFPVSKFLITDPTNKNQKVISNTFFKIGSAANQWFPTMMKTRINYTSNLKKALSIYDHFNKPALLKKMLTYGRRHFKKDSFYSYSKVVRYKNQNFLISAKTGRDWISKFESKASEYRKTHDYWLSPLKEEKKYTGYSEELRNAKFLTLSKKELNELPIPDQCKTNIPANCSANLYLIRLFEKGCRLFPDGFKAFRLSLCQAAVNFPPLTAKFIYERYLHKLGTQKAIIWDPSAGWGGRILGAMGISRDFQVHYIGTDPNTDHNTNNNRTKYHELADFYNQVRIGQRRTAKKRRLPKFINSYAIFQCGSEEMHKQPDFQKYKGKVDLVFTSPPYFAKEVYSEDAGQSANKFSDYKSWRDNFLQPTLENAVQWLRPGGYLIWNIANIQLSGKTLRLENDSCDILRSLGMNRVEVLKMRLAKTPGGNRTEIITEEISNIAPGKKSGIKPKAKIKAAHGCYVEIDGKENQFKYEPVLAYQKPIRAKSGGGKQREAPDSMEVVSEVTRLVNEFQKALNEPRINPHQLRAIYAALEKLLDGSDIAEFFRYFNKSRNDYFVRAKKSSIGKALIPQFVQRRVANKTVRTLAGKTVLVQLTKCDAGRKPKRLFAYARVRKPEYCDLPGTACIDILPEQQSAECDWGYTKEVAVSDILRISRTEAPFLLKQEK